MVEKKIKRTLRRGNPVTSSPCPGPVAAALGLLERTRAHTVERKEPRRNTNTKFTIQEAAASCREPPRIAPISDNFILSQCLRISSTADRGAAVALLGRGSRLRSYSKASQVREKGTPLGAPILPFSTTSSVTIEPRCCLPILGP